MINYSKRVELENLFYINKNGLVCLEEFRDIPCYEGLYKCSDLGRVKSLSRVILRKDKYRLTINEKIIKSTKNSGGYLQLALHKNGEKTSRTIHQLVAEVFLNHVPCGYALVVEHKNQVRYDCRLENLKIITQRENSNQKHLKSSSEYVGVGWYKRINKWRAKIRINDKMKNLGYFENEQEASEYYENALKAHLNNEEIIVKRREIKGYYFDKTKKRYIVNVRINGKRKHLGNFKTEIEAHNAYKKNLI